MAEEITKETKLSEQTIYNQAKLLFMVAFAQEERTNPAEASNKAINYADRYFKDLDWADAPNEPESGEK